ncbi:MAG: hypothetical protein F2754_10305 [Actinobacteria bacterium]|uniref:Unannotated protein n=1 Tax=freshwater metagenome TaxID=449393 RepID=A0A6J7AR37_9ZZZZ|nr:hypothetical protein [Actinomycetota bacterium]MSW92201.1 hypothetical protein [Actinomycetota bacterium]MSX87767.1 hypothetical protein [Actinomycetota bacterium]MSY72776.1 hypothetical protein [Actinomycetota bacterium]
MRDHRVSGALAVVALGLATIGGCSSSGRELPAPTTTKPVTAQIITTVTTR